MNFVQEYFNQVTVILLKKIYNQERFSKMTRDEFYKIVYETPFIVIEDLRSHLGNDFLQKTIDLFRFDEEYSVSKLNELLKVEENFKKLDKEYYNYKITVDKLINKIDLNELSYHKLIKEHPYYYEGILEFIEAQQDQFEIHTILINWCYHKYIYYVFSSHPQDLETIIQKSIKSYYDLKTVLLQENFNRLENIHKLNLLLATLRDKYNFFTYDILNKKEPFEVNFFVSGWIKIDGLKINLNYKEYYFLLAVIDSITLNKIYFNKIILKTDIEKVMLLSRNKKKNIEKDSKFINVRKKMGLANLGETTSPFLKPYLKDSSQTKKSNYLKLYSVIKDFESKFGSF